jgi:excisionase family DNA binding protein
MTATAERAPLLDADELARLLGVKRSTVLALARDRVVPSIRIGRRRRFRLADVGEAVGADLSAGPLLDADAVAATLNLRRSAVFELARRLRDPLPSVRVGRARRFETAAVESWLERQAG